MYFEMIKTEDTDSQYDNWKTYRDDLTKFIMEEARLCMDEDYDYAEKKVLAIFGAGGCNDIDIKRLSEHFRLVLIDRDIEKINYARNRFGINEQDCICVDLKFWDIEDHDYVIFEELLQEQNISELEKYLTHITETMVVHSYKDLPKFDISVVVSIASQLNVRFAALAEHYGYDIEEILRPMNQIAVKRMMVAARKMTKDMVIFGYESRGDSIVSGNECLLEEIKRSGRKIEKQIELEWPFSEEKIFTVHVLSQFMD